MSGDEFEGMTPDEVHEIFAAEEAKAREAFKDAPLPEISRVKRDDYPHWKPVGYFFQTTDGTRVLIDRGDGRQVEGSLRGVRPTTRGQDVLVVDFEGEWGCVRADGRDWAPAGNGRVRVDTLTMPVRATPLGQDGSDAQAWALQTHMERQP